MLFGKSSKKTKLERFCDKADDARINAYQTRNISPFVPYADPAVCTQVLSKILSGEEKSFGASKLRKREWDVQLDDGQVAHVVKRVEHEPIKVGRGITIPLGDPEIQQWDVSTDKGENFKIIKIRSVDE